MRKKGCPEEYPILLSVNGTEIAVFQLTNQDLEDWAYGYLFSEGFISQPEEVRSIRITEGKIRADLHNDLDVEEKFSGVSRYTPEYGRGATFLSMTDVKKFQKVSSKKTYLLSYLLEKQTELSRNSPMYLETGGMHAAAIVHPDGTLTVREDISRHNAVDKVIGYALRNGLEADERVLLTSGRISYEMLSKAAKLGFPVVCSRTAATRQAVELAKFLNIEVVGYLRRNMAVQYTAFGRVINDLEKNGS